MAEENNGELKRKYRIMKKELEKLRHLAWPHDPKYEGSRGEAEHPQVDVYYFGEDEIITVDEELVDILEILWDRGIETINSCQDNFDDIWIQINLDHFKKLLEDIKRDEKEEKEKEEEEELDLYEFFQTKCKKELVIHDDAYDRELDECVALEEIEFYASIRFNKKYRLQFLEMLRDFHGEVEEKIRIGI